MCLSFEKAATCRFNGATSSRTWKRVLAQRADWAAVGFNGATSSRTWKHAALMLSQAFYWSLQWSHVLTNVETHIAGSLWTHHFVELQWSHVLTNVETSRCAEHSGDCRFASMEPRPHERGNNSAAIQTFTGITCFNGATSSRTWKPMEPASRWHLQLASMEPRPHERGNARGFDLPPEARRLQWSHVLTNVETLVDQVLAAG